MHFGNDPRPGDKQPIMAEKDEYVVNRNAARKHKHLLDYLNFIDEPRFDNRDMAHSAIDEAMALNTLSQVGMQGGGSVKEPFRQRATNAIIDARMGLLGMFDPQLKHFQSDDMEDASEWQNVLGRGMTYNKMTEDMEGSAEDFRSLQETEFTEGQMKGAILRNKLSESVKDGDLGGSDINEEFSLQTDKNRYNLEPEHWYSPIRMKKQQGGLIEDKSKRKGGYGLGVKDELAESVDYFQDLDKILSAVRHQDRYDFGKSERSTIDWLGESGIMDIEEALKHLDHIQKRYHEGTVGFHMPRYQSGGTITYGDQSSNIPTLDEIYSMAGVKPNAEQRSQFEANFTYDPTREGTTISSYMGNLAGNRQSGSAGLGTATTKAQELGGGFAGFGERKAMTQEARAGAENIYGAAVESSKRGMFEDIRGDREAYIQAALSELTRLEGIGGTNPYSVSVGGMSEGETQFYNQNEWYRMGFPDEDSYNDWVAAGSDPSTMGSYGQDPNAIIGNLGITTGLSDRRLKKDVNYLFTMENNVPIYTFKYNWSDDIEIGTMAQDIEDIIPEAVSELNGYKLVDYKQIFK